MENVIEMELPTAASYIERKENSKYFNEERINIM
jgi:hypothetical protein